MSLLLKRSEIEELTGRVTFVAQCRMLDKLGIENKPRPGKWPAVDRAHYEQQMGIKQPRGKNKQAAPNWNAI